MKKFLLTLLVLLLSFALFAGGSGESAGTESNGPVTITFMHDWPEYESQFNQIIADFEAANPDIKVETTVITTTQAPGATVAPATTGDYSVQIAAFYAQDSADSLAARMRAYGNAVVVHEGDLYKVRIVNLDAANARRVIDALRSNEGMAPGLLQNGRWINADSI